MATTQAQVRWPKTVPVPQPTYMHHGKGWLCRLGHLRRLAWCARAAGGLVVVTAEACPHGALSLHDVPSVLWLETTTTTPTNSTITTTHPHHTETHELHLPFPPSDVQASSGAEWRLWSLPWERARGRLGVHCSGCQYTMCACRVAVCLESRLAARRHGSSPTSAPCKLRHPITIVVHLAEGCREGGGYGCACEFRGSGAHWDMQVLTSGALTRAEPCMGQKRPCLP